MLITKSRFFTRGFTIVELMVVVAIIGILATIATVSFTKISSDARDNQRLADVTAISESLETYYMKNGEYPSCTVINSGSSTISALAPSVVADTLTSPSAKTKGTSLTCGTGLVPSSMGDKYIYIGDGSTICNTGSSCRYWKIQYWNETDNTVVTVSSRHQTDATNVAAPGASTATMAYASGTVKGTPSPVSCAQGTPQYSVRSRLNDGTWSAYTAYSNTRNALATPAAQGDETDYQVQTRCFMTNEYVSSVTTGPVSSFVVPITAPSAPIASVNTSSPNAANWTWTTNTCPGSLTPSFRYIWSKDDATGWRAWSSAVTSTSSSQNTTDQGFKYQLKAQQRCNSTYASSPWSPESNTSAYIRDIDVPSAPSGYKYTSSSSSNGGYSQSTINISWTEDTCGSGTVKKLNLAVGYFVSASVPPNSTSYATGYGSYTPMWTNNANTQTYWKAASPNGYLTAYYANDSSVTASDVANTSDNFGLNANNDNPAWVSWNVTSANPLTLSSGDWSSSKQNTKYVFVRVYARNACYNPTTQRFAVGSPSFSPAWTWSGY
jgi:type IV pilus assembly protein PilE